MSDQSTVPDENEDVYCDHQRTIELTPDGKARYQRVVVATNHKGVVRNTRLMDEMTGDASLLLPSPEPLLLLPKDAIAVRRLGDNTVIVTQDRPRVRTVTWDIGRHLDVTRTRLIESNMHLVFGETAAAFRRRLQTQKKFRLAFPFVVTAYVFEKDVFCAAYLWYRTRPVAASTDLLYIANLPNLHTGGKICLPEKAKSIRGSHIEMIEVLRKILWTSAWNEDLINAYREHAEKQPALGSPWEWERQTKLDRKFVLHLPWQLYIQTFEEKLEHLLTDSTTTSYNRNVVTYFQQRLASGLKAQQEKADKADKSPAIAIDNNASLEVVTQSSANGPAKPLVISIGDCLEYDAKETGVDRLPIAMKRKNKVEWFSLWVEQADRSYLCYVKLAGLTDPLPLAKYADGKAILLKGWRLHPRLVTPKSVTLDGRTITPGMLIGIKSGSSTTAQVWHPIQKLTLGEKGEVLAQVQVTSEYDPCRATALAAIPIGKRGRAYRHIELRPPESAGSDGLLAIEELTLPNGLKLRQGMNLFLCSSGGMNLFLCSSGGMRYACFRGVRPLDPDGSRFAKFEFEDQSPEFLRLLLPNGDLADTLELFPPNPEWFVPEITAEGKRGEMVNICCGDKVFVDNNRYGIPSLSGTIQALTPYIHHTSMAQINGKWHLIVNSGYLLNNFTIKPNTPLT